MSNTLEKQNEVIIALLARSTIGVKAIYEAVTSGRRNPKAYVKMYNALRGDIGITKAAKIAGVSKGTMSGTLSAWQAQGIVYDVGQTNRPRYKRLLALPEEIG